MSRQKTKRQKTNRQKDKNTKTKKSVWYCNDKKTKRQKRQKRQKKTKRQQKKTKKATKDKKVKTKNKVYYCDVRAVSHSCDVFTFPFQPLIYRAPKNDLCLLVSSKVKSRGVDLCKLARVMGHHRRCQVATSRLSLPLCIFPCIYPCICSCIYPCICLKFQDIFVSNF